MQLACGSSKPLMWYNHNKSYLEDKEGKNSQVNVKLMVDVDQLDHPTVHNAVCNRQLNNREPNSSVSLINVQ